MSKRLLETIRIVDGKAMHLAYHQLRLERSLGASSLQLKDILFPPQSGVLRCRVVYDRNSYDVSYHNYVKRSVCTLKLIDTDGLDYSKKYVDRSDLEALFAKKGSADDILIVQKGLIQDTTIANVAFFYKNEWLTPKNSLLSGTTRARLLDEKRLKEVEISIDDLKSFESVALMNAMIDFDIIRNKKVEDVIC